MADLVGDLMTAAVHLLVRLHTSPTGPARGRETVVVGKGCRTPASNRRSRRGESESFWPFGRGRQGRRVVPWSSPSRIGRRPLICSAAELAREGRHAPASARDLLDDGRVARLQLVEVGARLPVRLRGREGVAAAAAGRREHLQRRWARPALAARRKPPTIRLQQKRDWRLAHSQRVGAPLRSRVPPTACWRCDCSRSPSPPWLSFLGRGGRRCLSDPEPAYEPRRSVRF